MIGLKGLLVEGIRNPVGFIHFISHFPEFLRLYGRLLLDGRVPIRLKALLIGADGICHCTFRSFAGFCPASNRLYRRSFRARGRCEVFLEEMSRRCCQRTRPSD